MSINKRAIVIQILITTVKVSTQFTGCWVVLILINYLIISNTAFQIVMSQYDVEPELLHGATGNHLG